MKTTANHTQAEELIQFFESIPAIDPTHQWESGILQKMHERKPLPYRRVSIPAMVLILMLLMNIGFYLVMNRSTFSNSRSSDLQAVSKSLLINPESLN